MSNPRRMNLNYLLNKAYYDEVPYEAYHKEQSEKELFSKYNNTLIEQEFRLSETSIPFADKENQPFLLKTAYPGLLIGIGNTHDAGIKYSGKEKNGAEIKLGFTLDYVTGLPVIPGSTVKGVLRSMFKYQPEYVAGELIKLGKEEIDLLTLWKNVFGSEDNYGKVVFFDAIPIFPGKNKRLFGLDNITPHPNPLKNPIPLSMLKIIPNVVFLFRFGFNYWNNENNVTSELLQKVFKRILLDLGIGAKTNVGFGAMELLIDEEEKILLKSPCYLKYSISI